MVSGGSRHVPDRWHLPAGAYGAQVGQVGRHLQSHGW